MSNGEFQQLKELLVLAADLPDEDRQAYLDEVCKDNVNLRRTLDSILKHDADPVSILKTDGIIRLALSHRLIGTTISHYHVIDELGVGGMGVVYKGEDTKLQRTVALKFLPPELMIDGDAKARFLREAQAAALLDHPGICAVHDIQETEDMAFIVMAYVEGETLRQRLQNGPLDLDEARIIAIQVAEGLQAAHDKGIIHRDIKPGNIMITSDAQAKITDFGLAKFTNTADVTLAGTRMGTIAYMSPEQARGDPVDHRTDIWSLGVVLYEMIAGCRPFKANHEEAILHFILNENPIQITTIRGNVPQEIEWIINRALVKNSQERYQNAEQMVADLRMALSVVRAASETKISVSAKPKPSIAVLPFSNISGDPSDDYFSDGLSEDLINALSQIHDLRVVARTSSFSFKGKDFDISEIGRKLRVETLLEGSIRRIGDRLRISALLVNVINGFHLWSGRYDRSIEDIFTVQDEISAAIANELKVNLFDKDLLASARHTNNLHAYELYLKGRYVYERNEFQKALGYFNDALSEDPSYALPYVGIADTFSLLSYHGYVPPEEAFPQAKKAAEKAIEIDSNLGEVYAALGWISVIYDYDWNEAKQHFDKARELSPNYEYTHLWYATYLWAIGETYAAKEAIRKALDIDPVSHIAGLFLGNAYLWAHECEKAIREFKKLIEFDPSYPMAHIWLGHTYIVMNEFDEAIAVLEPAVASNNDWTYAWLSLGWAYGLAGRKDDARAALGRLDKIAEKSYVRFTHRAFIHLGLEEYEEGFALLDKGRLAHEADVAFLTHPLFDRYRFRPEFIEIWGKMGFGKLMNDIEDR